MWPDLFIRSKQRGETKKVIDDRLTIEKENKDETDDANVVEDESESILPSPFYAYLNIFLFW